MQEDWCLAIQGYAKRPMTLQKRQDRLPVSDHFGKIFSVPSKTVCCSKLKAIIYLWQRTFKFYYFFSEMVMD